MDRNFKEKVVYPILKVTYVFFCLTLMSFSDRLEIKMAFFYAKMVFHFTNCLRFFFRGIFRETNFWVVSQNLFTFYLSQNVNYHNLFPKNLMFGLIGFGHFLLYSSKNLSFNTKLVNLQMGKNRSHKRSVVLT